MAQNYFNNDHFKLLNKWKGTVYDKTNPEQQRVYEELGKAYDVTKQWADALQEQLFTGGWTKTVRKPTDQWQKKFIPYNWARIYPSNNAPEGLAYTVGIDADLGFVVKIDLVDIKVNDPVLRKKYEQIRGPLKSSPIVAIKSADDGLALDFTALVDWSAEAIKNFKISYDDLADQLELSADADNESLLTHFQGHEDFVERQPLWTATTTELFGRLARAVNEMGLDWWFTRSTNSQLRFGRKEKGAIKGGPVGWLFLRKDSIRVSWSAFAGLDELEQTDLTNELVQLFEAADKDEGSWPAKLGPRAGRNGYWPDDYDIEDEPKSDKPPKNVIYYGPPGTGKTFDLQALLVSDYTDAEYGERYEFVTFHQSYGYEEFVEGLRPVITKRGKKRAADCEPAAASDGEVRYEIKPGAFLRLCDRARMNPSRQYAMVIDEINRGNISKIFGELITLVEVDKREGAKHPVAVTLPYSAESFSAPSNVDVIGTMNTADRSLALVDTALRRRFEFIESMPKPSVLAGTRVSHNGVDINIEQLLTMLNKRIEALYDRDHTVGHAYFTRIKDLQEADRFNELKAVFKNKIIPLLEEYFFEDWQKIRLVLGDNQKPKHEHQFVHEISREEDLLALFGREHELDQYATRSRYQLNAAALDEPDAYVGIYSVKSDVTAV
ncbi:AAA family ATPase [Pseudomonas sp. WJP1]|uniref:McrB family protein n=1 Tax=Pseudomonas sp. WJP1 TaxID=2986947 RepID=UPI002349C20B|nr:AAA family ATPase [Pseudomonas sp. WJP1]WCM50802.1 AAA family ATPase [Pseudomonas sp. WJP1]